MRNRARFYLAVAAAVILFDAAASFASKSFGFDYTSLARVSLFLYFISGYIGCKYYGLAAGISAGSAAGIVDATIGWALSSAIGAHLPFEQPDYTFPLILGIIVSVSMEATIFGLIGALSRLAINKFGKEVS